MGLLDKLKNVFFEEEEVEVEEKPKKEKVKKEKPLVKKIENPKKEKKEEKIEVKPEPIIEKQPEEEKDLDLDLDFTKVEEEIFEEDQDVMEENDLIRRPADKDFKFPIILDEDEPVEEELPIQNEEYKEAKWDNNIYGDDKIDVDFGVGCSETHSVYHTHYNQLRSVVGHTFSGGRNADGEHALELFCREFFKKLPVNFAKIHAENYSQQNRADYT